MKTIEKNKGNLFKTANVLSRRILQKLDETFSNQSINWTVYESVPVSIQLNDLTDRKVLQEVF